MYINKKWLFLAACTMSLITGTTKSSEENNIQEKVVDMDYIWQLYSKTNLEKKFLNKEIKEAYKAGDKQFFKENLGKLYYLTGKEGALYNALFFASDDSRENKVEAMNDGIEEWLSTVSCSSAVCEEQYEKVREELKDLVTKYKENMESNLEEE